MSKLVKLRIILYSLPLLLQWLPGLTWEKNDQALRFAKCALLLFLLFIGGLLVSLVIHLLANAVTGVLGVLGIILGSIAATLHSLFVLAYIISSIILAYEGCRGEILQMKPLEQVADKMQKLVTT